MAQVVVRSLHVAISLRVWLLHPGPDRRLSKLEMRVIDLDLTQCLWGDSVETENMLDEGSGVSWWEGVSSLRFRDPGR